MNKADRQLVRDCYRNGILDDKDYERLEEIIQEVIKDKQSKEWFAFTHPENDKQLRYSAIAWMLHTSGIHNTAKFFVTGGCNHTHMIGKTKTITLPRYYHDDRYNQEEISQLIYSMYRLYVSPHCIIKNPINVKFMDDYYRWDGSRLPNGGCPAWMD